MTQEEEVEECLILRSQRCLSVGDVDPIDIELLDARIAAFPRAVLDKVTEIIVSEFQPALN